MVSAEPLRLRLVAAEFADRVPSPAHDSLTASARARVVAENPDSFLAVTPSLDSVDTNDPQAIERLLLRGRSALERLVERGAFGPEIGPSYFVYQLSTETHSQTGLVAGIAIEDFVSGQVRVHEQIRSDRSAHLAQHLSVVGAQSSPIAVAHAPIDDLSRVLSATIDQRAADLEITSDPTLTQRIWEIDAEHHDAIAALLADQMLYLVDGHHRAAAASEYRAAVGPGPADLVLCALFPTTELVLLPFHRVLPSSVGGQDAVRSLVGDGARPMASPTDIGHAELAMFDGVQQSWWALAAPPAEGINPAIASLAPARLAACLDRSINQWRDVVGYRSGSVGVDQLVADAITTQQLVVLLPAIDIDDLLAVAEAGLAMPPKSTSFEPKVRSGVFLRHI